MIDLKSLYDTSYDIINANGGEKIYLKRLGSILEVLEASGAPGAP